MTIYILDRYSKHTLYASEALTPRAAVEEAVAGGVNLGGADLSNTDLSFANLTGAKFRRADFSNTNLSNTNLSNANFTGASFIDADLSYADCSQTVFCSADLCYADLKHANIHNANLTRARLSRANLCDVNLAHANLHEIRHDVFRILDHAPNEVPGLLDAVRNGHINGNIYEGECACLVGTIAKLRNINVHDLPDIIQPNYERPAERFVLGIFVGDTPTTNPISSILEMWILKWQGL